MSETPQYIIVSSPQLRKFDDTSMQTCLNECGVGADEDVLTPSEKWLFVKNRLAKYLNEEIGIPGKLHLVSLNVGRIDQDVKLYLRNNGITHVLSFNEKDYTATLRLFVIYEDMQRVFGGLQNVVSDVSIISYQLQINSKNISPYQIELTDLSTSFDDWAGQGEAIISGFGLMLKKAVQDLIVLSL